jgi:HD-like signal output (HDOD) protein
MIFNGDLSKYHPADAIMFLSQLNLNGIFSIIEEQRVITLSFSKGFVIDAHSGRGDAKILQALIYHRRVAGDQVRHIRRVQTETGMPLRAILAQLDFFPLADVADILMMGMHEVLLEMFLLDHGSFHFTDTPVDPDDAETRLDARMLAIRVAAQSDEFREFEKSIVSLDRQYHLSVDHRQEPPSTDEKVVLRLAANCERIGQLIEKAPIDTYAAMEIARDQIEKGMIVLLPPAVQMPPKGDDTRVDPVFAAFRQAMKKMILNKDPLKQLETLVTYCKGFYDGMLILTARDGHLVHCKTIIRQDGHGFAQRSHKGPLGEVDQDAILSTVHHSGIGFFGEPFPSMLLDQLVGPVPEGECALIPVAVQGAVSLFLYVFNRKTFCGLSPQHYLELLSWVTTASRTETAGITARKGEAGTGTPAPVRLVDMIDDLPPMSALVSRALELLADPDASMQDIEKVIEKDQSLVSKLIRVSNSALYGGLQRVESLQQALTRLGAKTSRSLIVAASMQNYFLKINSSVQALGQELWQHAAECGLAARQIASILKYDDPEKAFMGGVVHDIGKLVILLTNSDAFRQILNLRRREPMTAVAAESKILGIDHVTIGVQLMEKWKMPASALLCVNYHHHADAAGENRPLAAIVAYANHLSHIHGALAMPPSADKQAEIDALAAYLGLAPDRQQALAASLVIDFQNSGIF